MTWFRSHSHGDTVLTPRVASQVQNDPLVFLPPAHYPPTASRTPAHVKYTCNPNTDLFSLPHMCA